MLDANPAACERLGYGREALAALPLAALEPATAPGLQHCLAAALESGESRLDTACLNREGVVLPVQVESWAVDLGPRRTVLALLHGLGELRRTESILRTVAAGTAALHGEAFFQALVRHLAEALGVRYAFIAEFADTRSRVRVLAFWSRSRFLDNFEYDLADTPCEAVLQGQVCHYAQGIQRLFPKGQGMTDLRAESYLAIPLTDAGGEVLGHLAAVDTKPMPKRPLDLSLFNIFGARAAAELKRLGAERQLAESEQRLSTVLASAMDAVITFDEQHRVTLFNTAAGKIFHCAPDWARGQPFDRFLSRRFRSLLDDYLRNLPRDGPPAPLWIPEGLTALRADGGEFPIEATLSPMRLGGRAYYTVILRDVNERERARQALGRLHMENRYLQEQASGGRRHADIVGGSPAMGEVLERIGKVAATDSTVLILGETGTGKEMLAQAIHDRSPRRDKLLVIVNCAALPADLIESELFGHEKGAFTGATAQRKGRFELADGGTLFLDELGELSASAQAKLLRVLQQQTFERVGGVKTLRVNVRLIAATNRDLGEMVKAGSFRADLYYRLNVFPVRIPPLRERREDIPALAEHFLRNLDRKLGKPLTGVSPRSLERLLGYAWPGNIRELQNVIERAAILANGPVIEVDEALDLRLEPGAEEPVAPKAGSATLAAMEREYIRQVLESTGWVIEGAKGAAAVLGLKPSTLRFRIQKLGIRRPQSAA